MLYSRRLISFFALAAALLLCIAGVQHNDAKSFHTRLELEYLEGSTIRSPIDSGQYFLHSIRCKGCHGYDTLQVANVDSNGTDINLYDDWQTTMMANAAKDPLWRAKVSHEILVNPGHAGDLQTKCTSCHAPLGHFTAVYHGAMEYTIDDLLADTLGLDGVSCGGCHEIGTENLGTVFSGAVPYDTTKKEFGPFENPLAGPMQLYEGFTPTFSTHMSKSQVCASCHTLITSTADLQGNYTGNTFVEQATYHEWLNSAFAAENITCQACHMPQLKDSIIIANNILALAPRSPFNQHQFAGGNAFMVALIKQNKTALDINAPDVNFDSTLAATYKLLQQKTAGLAAFVDSIASDTLYISVRVSNKAGHKFPSGYPSRRAVLQMVVTTQDMDTVFQSGTFDANFEVQNISATYEPHHNVINSSNEAQVYEMVMGDVNGDVTTILERADHMIKDNRLPPEGFVTTHPDYDTVQIAGYAVADPDFNKNGNEEGTGIDYVHYHIPLNGVGGILQVYAGIFYQSVTPRYLENMFTYSSPAIDSFKNMYYEADRTPVLVASSTSNTPFILSAFSPLEQQEITIENTITESGTIRLLNNNQVLINAIAVYDAGGNLKSNYGLQTKESAFELALPAAAGLYLVTLQTDHGTYVFKVIRM